MGLPLERRVHTTFVPEDLNLDPPSSSDLIFKRFRPAGMIGPKSVVLWHEGLQAIILAGSDGTRAGIWVSKDLGHTWPRKYTSDETGVVIESGIVTMAGYAILAHYRRPSPPENIVLRSTDLENWEKVVITHWGGWWHWTEDDDGNVYAHTYGGSYGVRRTKDQGKTWTFHDITPTDTHIHDLQYDPWGKRMIAATGDTQKYILATTDLANLDPASWQTMIDFTDYQVTAILPKSEEILLGSDIGSGNEIRRYSRDFLDYVTGVALVKEQSVVGVHRNVAHVWDLKEAFPFVVSSLADGQLYWSDTLRKWRRLYLGSSCLWDIDDSPLYLFVSGSEGIYVIPKNEMKLLGNPVPEVQHIGRDLEVRTAGANYWAQKYIYKGTKQRTVTLEIVNTLDQQLSIYIYGSHYDAFPTPLYPLGTATNVPANTRTALDVTTGLPYLMIMIRCSVNATIGNVNVWALLDEY